MYEKVANISDSHGYTDQSHKEISPICQNDYSQKIKEKGCENVDKLEIG